MRTVVAGGYVEVPDSLVNSNFEQGSFAWMSVSLLLFLLSSLLPIFSVSALYKEWPIKMRRKREGKRLAVDHKQSRNLPLLHSWREHAFLNIITCLEWICCLPIVRQIWPCLGLRCWCWGMQFWFVSEMGVKDGALKFPRHPRLFLLHPGCCGPGIHWM